MFNKHKTAYKLAYGWHRAHHNGYITRDQYLDLRDAFVRRGYIRQWISAWSSWVLSVGIQP